MDLATEFKEKTTTGLVVKIVASRFEGNDVFQGTMLVEVMSYN